MMKRQARSSTAAVPSPIGARARSLLLAVLIALVYGALARLGWAGAQPPLLWPPAALMFAALLLTPVGFWKLLLVPLFIAHLAARAGSAALASAALEFCLTLIAVMFGALALRQRLAGAPRFDQLRDVALFAVCAPATAALAALAVAGSGWIAERSPWTDLWRSGFCAQALAFLLLTPLLVACAQRLSVWLEGATAPALARRQTREAAALALCAVIAAAIAGRLFLPLFGALWAAPLLWAALRFTPLAACAVLALLGAASAWALHLGAFAQERALLQGMLAALALVTLLCAALAAERRRALAQAQDQEKLLGLALHAAPMTSWTWNLDSQTIAVKTAASDPFQGRLFVNCLEHIHDDDRRAVELALTAALERGEPYEVEFRLRGADGALRSIRSRGAPQRDGRGRPARVLGMTVDISERRRREQQIREQRQELAHLGRVAMLGELSGAITHELNQPLTTVLSNAQAAQQLLEGAAPDLDEIRAILDDIVAENKRAGEIIRRLRTLLKKGEIQLQEVDINELVLEVIGLEHSDLIARNVSVSTRLAPQLPLVRADRVQIQQVLLNLMMNAGDAMAQTHGERLIRIGTCFEAGFVQIRVGDRGPGLPARYPERIFEAFFTTKEQGLGLGLTICRSIINAHGGELHARDTGQGALFTVALPCAPAQEAAS